MPAGVASSATDAAGHRRRLRARFMSSGGENMPDYELIEMVLFAALPRGDVKPLARRLIKRFGGFADALAAPPEKLAEVEGMIVSHPVVYEAA